VSDVCVKVPGEGEAAVHDPLQVHVDDRVGHLFHHRRRLRKKQAGKDRE